jgi:uridine kinase
MSKASGMEIVGIAAPTCAGKTSLVQELLRRMPVSAVGLSMDEYDLFPADSAAMEEELRNPKITNWEDPALFDLEQFADDICMLAEHQSIRLNTRSRESMAAGETERVVRPARTTIVEGVFALHHPVARAAMDLTVFVDIPLEQMVERRLATLRSGSVGNPWDDPDYIKGAMVEGTIQYVLPQRKYAQMVLDGTRPTAYLADLVMRQLN